MLDVSHEMFTLFHPQENSKVERMVNVIRNLISALEWDKNGSGTRIFYRIPLHKVTGFTASYVITGRGFNAPIAVVLGMGSLDVKVMAFEYMNRLQTRLETFFTEVQISLKNLRKPEFFVQWKKTRKKQGSSKLVFR